MKSFKYSRMQFAVQCFVSISKCSLHATCVRYSNTHAHLCLKFLCWFLLVQKAILLTDDTTKTGLVLESPMSAVRANATFKCIHFMAKKWICTNLLLTNMLQIYKYWGVNIWQTWQMPHSPSYLHPLFFGMQMWHLPSLSYVYSSVFTYLRHICKEQICANPFFRPVN